MIHLVILVLIKRKRIQIVLIFIVCKRILMDELHVSNVAHYKILNKAF